MDTASACGRRSARSRDPGPVAPLVRALEHHRGGARRRLGGRGQRVGLQAQRAVGAADLELVVPVGADAGHEELPDPRRPQRAHRVHPSVPAVPVAHHAHRARRGRPHRERRPGDAVDLAQVRAEALPQALVAALADQVQVELADGRQERVGVGARGRCRCRTRPPPRSAAAARSPRAASLEQRRRRGARARPARGRRGCTRTTRASGRQTRTTIPPGTGWAPSTLWGSWWSRAASRLMSRSMPIGGVMAPPGRCGRATRRGRVGRSWGPCSSGRRRPTPGRARRTRAGRSRSPGTSAMPTWGAVRVDVHADDRSCPCRGPWRRRSGTGSRWSGSARRCARARGVSRRMALIRRTRGSRGPSRRRSLTSYFSESRYSSLPGATAVASRFSKPE